MLHDDIFEAAYAAFQPIFCIFVSCKPPVLRRGATFVADYTQKNLHYAYKRKKSYRN